MTMLDDNPDDNPNDNPDDKPDGKLQIFYREWDGIYVQSVRIQKAHIQNVSTQNVSSTKRLHTNVSIQTSP
jgi:hypothetical protein